MAARQTYALGQPVLVTASRDPPPPPPPMRSWAEDGALGNQAQDAGALEEGALGSAGMRGRGTENWDRPGWRRGRGKWPRRRDQGSAFRRRVPGIGSGPWVLGFGSADGPWGSEVGSADWSWGSGFCSAGGPITSSRGQIGDGCHNHIITFYEEKNFQGRSYECMNDCSDMSSYLSRCQSCRVESGCFMVYDRTNYMGNQYYMKRGDYSDYQNWMGMSGVKSCRMIPMVGLKHHPSHYVSTFGDNPLET
ncbi:Gamma-crystallin M3 [Liparis tanakae]|uniref:Gamma-crystallin M3 n=1 Tax=Liparis tanakae TaxID=230148 RepID=A0A4Z2F7U3_9TELE|nr:Gamma-crystallin M3 [Liparis tanakae]